MSLRSMVGRTLRQVTGLDRVLKKAALQRLADLGYRPGTAFDVGAQVGTPEIYSAFPAAHHVLIEPVEENMPALHEWQRKLKSAEVLHAGVADKPGTMGLNVSKDHQYASLSASGSRQVRTVSLDSLVAEKGYRGPFLVKIDVDGFEMPVLAGAKTLMRPDAAFLIETTFLDKGARFKPVIDAMYAAGFVVADIVDPVYRPRDRALWQVDLLFLHASNPIVATSTYED